jgi:hypothetical protein
MGAPLSPRTLLRYAFEPVLLRRSLHALLILVCAAILSAQLFFPPFIGIANNGDFGKVIGWLSLTTYGSSDEFIYFKPDFILLQRAFWDSPYRSVEIPLGWIAMRVSGVSREGDHFDIRALGAIHAAIFLGALAVLLAATGRLPLLAQLAIAAAAILAFTDVCYAAYLNSFYMDAPALGGLLLLTAAAAWISSADQPRAGSILLYGVAGLLFVTSKTQHALWALLPAAFLIAISIRWTRRALRWTGIGTAAALVLAGGLMIRATDRSYPAQPLFNVLFYRIGAAGPAAMADLRQLGVREDEARFLGTHSFQPGSPMNNRQWGEAFYARTGYARLFRWYAEHPGRTARTLYEVLASYAPEMRPNNLSNYRRQDGHPPGDRTNRFAAWSNLRSEVQTRWPWLVVLWYVLFVAGAIATIRRRPSAAAVRLAWLAGGIAVLGAGEFVAAALVDCIETPRHLLMFHACTDLTFCFAVAAAVSRLWARAASRAKERSA